MIRRTTGNAVPARLVGLGMAIVPLVLALACRTTGTDPANPGDASIATSAPLGTAASQGMAIESEGAATEASPVEADATASTVPSSSASATPTALEDLRIELFELASGFDSPLLVTHAPDGSGRIYIVEQAGRIYSMDLEDPEGSRSMELDIRERIEDGASEQGLLGLAFHPDFERNRRLFVNYTDLAGDTVVAELRALPGTDGFDPASEETILAFEQPAGNHNGGHLAFGPDGMLFVATGDGGGADDRYGHGQNPGSLLGKILRIDVDARQDGAAYGLPPDNPFLDREGYRPETWAWGLRNPWRFSFDRQTGDLYIGDVGQARWEEIDLMPAGSAGFNFGWPIFEGRACQRDDGACQDPSLQAPILVYEHQAGACSVTGGYVYRGPAEDGGAALQGAYLYADYCSGQIRVAREEAGGWRSRVILETELDISSFGQDEAGRLYLSDLDGGSIYRIRPGQAEEPGL